MLSDCQGSKNDFGFIQFLFRIPVARWLEAASGDLQKAAQILYSPFEEPFNRSSDHEAASGDLQKATQSFYSPFEEPLNLLKRPWGWWINLITASNVASLCRSGDS